MNFDDFDIDVEYEEAFPQDKEMKAWMDSIDRDYAEELAALDVDDDVTVICDDDMEEDADY